jgi:hypothetical protein
MVRDKRLGSSTQREAAHELSLQQLVDHLFEVQKGREIHSGIPFPTGIHLLVDTFEGAFTLTIDRHAS